MVCLELSPSTRFALVAAIAAHIASAEDNERLEREREREQKREREREREPSSRNQL